MHKKTLTERNFVSGAFMLIFAAALFFQTIGGDDSVMLFARIVSAISFLCGGLTCILALKGEKGQNVFDRRILFDIGFPVLIFLICMLNSRLGFYTSMFIVCMTAMTILLWNQKLTPVIFMVRIIGSAFLITTGMYLMFHMVLGVITPTGVFI